jgi:hypothetical protein
MNLGQIDTRGTEVAPLIPINSDDDKDKEVRQGFFNIRTGTTLRPISPNQILNKPESS